MRRIANGVRNYIRAASLSNGGNVTTLAQQVAVILAKYGTDAHVYLPGIGVNYRLTPGNYLDSAGTTAATVDNPVGKVDDAAGAIDATQATTANKPILRYSSGRYSWQFDGTDSLALGSVPFQMADDHCVIAGANPADATTNKRLFLVGGATATPIVAMVYFAGASLLGFWRDDAGVTSSVSTTYLSNTPIVVSLRKIGNAKSLKKNGISIGTNSTVLGITTLTASNIGVSTHGVIEPYKGDSYPIIAIKGTVTDADLLILEKWVGSLSGVSI
jgi:hypothetical protein